MISPPSRAARHKATADLPDAVGPDRQSRGLATGALATEAVAHPVAGGADRSRPGLANREAFTRAGLAAAGASAGG